MNYKLLVCIISAAGAALGHTQIESHREVTENNLSSPVQILDSSKSIVVRSLEPRADRKKGTSASSLEGHQSGHASPKPLPRLESLVVNSQSTGLNKDIGHIASGPVADAERIRRAQRDHQLGSRPKGLAGTSRSYDQRASLEEWKYERKKADWSRDTSPPKLEPILKPIKYPSSEYKSPPPRRPTPMPSVKASSSSDSPARNPSPPVDAHLVASPASPVRRKQQFSTNAPQMSPHVRVQKWLRQEHFHLLPDGSRVIPELIPPDPDADLISPKSSKSGGLDNQDLLPKSPKPRSGILERRSTDVSSLSSLVARTNTASSASRSRASSRSSASSRSGRQNGLRTSDMSTTSESSLGGTRLNRSEWLPKSGMYLSDANHIVKQRIGEAQDMRTKIVVAAGQTTAHMADVTRKTGTPGVPVGPVMSANQPGPLPMPPQGFLVGHGSGRMAPPPIHPSSSTQAGQGASSQQRQGLLPARIHRAINHQEKTRQNEQLARVTRAYVAQPSARGYWIKQDPQAVQLGKELAQQQHNDRRNYVARMRAQSAAHDQRAREREFGVTLAGSRPSQISPQALRMSALQSSGQTPGRETQPNQGQPVSEPVLSSPKSPIADGLKTPDRRPPLSLPPSVERPKTPSGARSSTDDPKLRKADLVSSGREIPSPASSSSEYFTPLWSLKTQPDLDGDSGNAVLHTLQKRGVQDTSKASKTMGLAKDEQKMLVRRGQPNKKDSPQHTLPQIKTSRSSVSSKKSPDRYGASSSKPVAAAQSKKPYQKQQKPERKSQRMSMRKDAQKQHYNEMNDVLAAVQQRSRDTSDRLRRLKSTPLTSLSKSDANSAKPKANPTSPVNNQKDEKDRPVPSSSPLGRPNQDPVSSASMRSHDEPDFGTMNIQRRAAILAPRTDSFEESGGKKKIANPAFPSGFESSASFQSRPPSLAIPFADTAHFQDHIDRTYNIPRRKTSRFAFARGPEDYASPNALSPNSQREQSRFAFAQSPAITASSEVASPRARRDSMGEDGIPMGLRRIKTDIPGIGRPSDNPARSHRASPSRKGTALTHGEWAPQEIARSWKSGLADQFPPAEQSRKRVLGPLPHLPAEIFEHRLRSQAPGIDHSTPLRSQAVHVSSIDHSIPSRLRAVQMPSGNESPYKVAGPSGRDMHTSPRLTRQVMQGGPSRGSMSTDWRAERQSSGPDQPHIDTTPTSQPGSTRGTVARSKKSPSPSDLRLDLSDLVRSTGKQHRLEPSMKRSPGPPRRKHHWRRSLTSTSSIVNSLQRRTSPSRPDRSQRPGSSSSTPSTGTSPGSATPDPGSAHSLPQTPHGKPPFPKSRHSTASAPAILQLHRNNIRPDVGPSAPPSIAAPSSLQSLPSTQTSKTPSFIPQNPYLVSESVRTPALVSPSTGNLMPSIPPLRSESSIRPSRSSLPASLRRNPVDTVAAGGRNSRSWWAPEASIGQNKRFFAQAMEIGYGHARAQGSSTRGLGFGAAKARLTTGDQQQQQDDPITPPRALGPPDTRPPGGGSPERRQGLLRLSEGSSTSGSLENSSMGSNSPNASGGVGRGGSGK